MSLPKLHLPQCLSHLNRQIWILAAGRLLSRIGTGFILFYALCTDFLVHQVGLSATLVGIAIGSDEISGIAFLRKREVHFYLYFPVACGLWPKA